MIVPNAENAVVDIRKLRDYCLNPLHAEGKHKARTFYAALGLTAENAEALRVILLETIKNQNAKLGRLDEYGQRYIMDLNLHWQGKQTVVRSGWIIETNSNIPRLTTCYPL